MKVSTDHPHSRQGKFLGAHPLQTALCYGNTPHKLYLLTHKQCFKQLSFIEYLNRSQKIFYTLNYDILTIR